MGWYLLGYDKEPVLGMQADGLAQRTRSNSISQRRDLLSAADNDLINARGTLAVPEPTRLCGRMVHVHRYATVAMALYLEGHAVARSGTGCHAGSTVGDSR